MYSNPKVGKVNIFFFDNLLALLTHVSAGALCLDFGIAFPAESPALILDESQVSQLFVAHFARETLGVPGGVHGLDDPTHNELA